MIAGSFSPAEAFPVVEPFRDEVIAAGLRPAQWVLVSFLVTVGCVRAYTYAVRHGWGPFGNLSVRGVRVHHLVPGIFLLLGSGFLAKRVPTKMFNGYDEVAGIYAGMDLAKYY